MPVNYTNTKAKNAAEELLGQEDQNTRDQRGYAVAQPVGTGFTQTGRPINYSNIYNTRQAPDYVTKEGARIRSTPEYITAQRQLDADATARTTPSVAGIRATGLPTDEVLAAQANLTAGTPTFSSPYLNRAYAGINDLFGGVSSKSIEIPDVTQLSTPERTHYAELTRLNNGVLPTAAAASAYEGAGELGRQKLQEFSQEAGITGAEGRNNNRYRHQSPVY